jgi:uncharacterized heparinase superfamily protein
MTGLRRLLPSHVLADGGHFERSPMYHAIVLHGLLDLVNALPPGDADRAWLAGVCARMQDALPPLVHPDGGLALFNDAALEIAPPPARLAAYAEAVLGRRARPPRDLPATGYAVLDTRRDAGHASEGHASEGHASEGGAPSVYLVVDAGAVGPDHLPAHAHADVFSVELSVGGVRFVVDSGTYDYVPGPRRAYLRSTRAHNTVTLDDTDQVECWGSHRVARRARPHAVQVTRAPGRWRFTGCYDGYARLLGDGLRHRRTITWHAAGRADAGGGVLRLDDEVTGAGRHTAAARLHLHPAVTVAPAGDGAFTLRRDGHAVHLHLAGAGGDVRVEDGLYCPRFGEAHPTRVVTWRRDGYLPARCTATLRLG